MKTILPFLILAVVLTGAAFRQPHSPGSGSFYDVFQAYFQIKDALVKSDVENASLLAGRLPEALQKIEMDKLGHEEHVAWMKVEKELKQDAQSMASADKIAKQREYFIRLSENIHLLMKASKPVDAVYYQLCPMANGGKGAHWLSKENPIKNPYYGSSMLTCGRTVETIQQ